MRLGISGWVLAAGLLCAQYPGRYPPGQYPGQIPFPRLPVPGRGQKNPGGGKPSAKEVLQQFTGKIGKIEKDSLTIEAPDTRTITFKCSKTTKYLQDGKEIQRAVLQAGDEVDIEARSDDQGYFYAVNVKRVKAFQPPAKPEAAEAEQAPAQQASTVEAPPPRDPDIPILRRGKPEPRPRSSDEESEAEPLSANSPASAAGPPDAFLGKARAVTLEFSEVLPNYICNQFTTRYEGEGRPVNWRPLDVVSAAVAYEDGKESYHDIRINNKPVNKPMEQISGSWSRGEFGTTLRDLFSPATAADFRFRRESTAAGRAASVYDFQVEQLNSHWQTILGGQSVLPAYKGSVWIDKKTFRILRIEMQARDVPQEFPLDTIEWVVDYSFVRIAGAEYLLPVHAENLSCWRGDLRCVRNALDFRNYRKFTSESQITTTDSTITFDGEESPKPAAKKK
ncbi:MAG: hypothetical protein ACE15B_15635 [Bryobacteraceae bacterium]